MEGRGEGAGREGGDREGGRGKMKARCEGRKGEESGFKPRRR